MNNARDQYAFVIVGYGTYVYDYIFRDVSKLPCAAYDHDACLTPFARALRKVHLSSKVNRIVPLPFREIWVKIWVRQLKQKLDAMPREGRTPCFVLLDNILFFEQFGLSQTIREMIPGARVVYYFADLVALDQRKQQLLRSGTPDLIFSYDKGDAQRYHLLQHDLPYSDLQKNDSDQHIEYDVCLIAKAKGRLPQILEAYTYLTQHGFRCGFWITEVPKNQQQYSDQICYCDAMTYDDCMKIVSKSKCVLEIVQEGSAGNTLRVNEVLAFNKILITNNPNIVNSESYDPRYMFYYTHIQQLDCAAIRKIDKVCYENRDRISVECFLEDVATALKNAAL